MSLMGLLLETTVKSSLVMLAALVAVACLRRRSAALRHWILSAAIVAATASPVLGLVMPSWHVPLDGIAPRRSTPMALPLPPARARAAARPAAPAGVRKPRAVSLPGAGVLVPTTWIAGAGVSVLILLDRAGPARLDRLRALAASTDGPMGRRRRGDVAREYGLRRPVVILQSDHPALLVTWGFVAAEGDSAADRAGLDRRAHPRRAVARARPHQARRLADPDAGGDRARRLLVQPGHVDRLPAPAPGKRAGDRRRRAARRHQRIRLRLAPAGARARLRAPSPVAARAGDRPAIESRKESQRHVERPNQPCSHHPRRPPRHRRRACRPSRSPSRPRRGPSRPSPAPSSIR